MDRDEKLKSLIDEFEKLDSIMNKKEADIKFADMAMAMDARKEIKNKIYEIVKAMKANTANEDINIMHQLIKIRNKL